MKIFPAYKNYIYFLTSSDIQYVTVKVNNNSVLERRRVGKKIKNSPALILFGTRWPRGKSGKISKFCYYILYHQSGVPLVCELPVFLLGFGNKIHMGKRSSLILSRRTLDHIKITILSQ